MKSDRPWLCCLTAAGKSQCLTPQLPPLPLPMVHLFLSNRRHGKGAWVYFGLQRARSRHSGLQSQLASLEQPSMMGAVMLKVGALLHKKHGAHQTKWSPVPSQLHCRRRYAGVSN